MEKRYIDRYFRTLLVELYKPQKFISPGVYIRESDISVISYDLVSNPSNSGSTICISSRAIGGVFNEPIKIESAEQFRNFFDDV